jgi:spore coat polysaccharide biosynthesis protein SpsF
MNFAVVSQARMTSTRLPGKVLAEIDGRPMLHYHVERIHQHDLPVVVAATTNEDDEPIVSFCREHEIDVFRGDEHDVLARYYDTAEAYDLDVIVRATSDCPLIDGEKVREGVEKYLDQAGSYDYLGTSIPQKTYPLGFSFEVFDRRLLRAAHKNASHPKMREHVTPYMKQKKHPSTTLLGHPLDQDWSEYRVTVDTPEDLTMVRRLIVDWEADTRSVGGIVDLLQEHPELQAINRDVHQKKWFE